MALPIEIQTPLTIPAAEVGADGQLMWSGLPGPSGSIKILGRLSARAAPGSVLSIAASLVDGLGSTAS
ncbi:MAG: hypothetical protein HYR72_12810 [Deltaproteobacteria bacterium]|nr:hypothetical protein [Deltaproteobacteria bacterium]MBI3387903.1 hypothetical protein [Deltaproteobacteria bacterium]